jgi:hypothetical protein
MARWFCGCFFLICACLVALGWMAVVVAEQKSQEAEK